MACGRNLLKTQMEYSVLLLCSHSPASLEGWGKDEFTGVQQWTSWFRNLLAAVWNRWAKWQRALGLRYVGEKVNVIYDSLLNKIPGGVERSLWKYLLGKKKRRMANERFVFKQERQDVGAIVISLNSSARPRVLTRNFCATECDEDEKLSWWMLDRTKCLRSHVGQTGGCQMSVDTWWSYKCVKNNSGS